MSLRAELVRPGVVVVTLMTSGFLASSAPAAAPPPEVKDLFSRGRDLRERGDCASAVPLFRQAFEQYREGLGSLRNLAECEEDLGHLVAARHAWLSLQAELRNNHEPKYADWAADAQEGAVRLAPRVATLRVDVENAESGTTARASDIEVTINGGRLPKEQFGVALEEDPGHYVVRADIAGRDHDERAVDLAAGDSRRISLRVPAGPPSSLAASVRGETGGQRNERVGAWIATGIGAASLVGAGAAWLARLGAVDEFSKACPDGGRCHTKDQYDAAQSIRDRGVSATTAAQVLGVVGLAGVATGAVLFGVRYSQSGDAALILSPTTVSAVGTF